MSVDPVTISPALPAKGSAPSTTPAAGEGGPSFTTALAGAKPTVPAATGAPPPSQPASEVSRFALPGGGNRLGDQVLTRIESIHQGDLSVRARIAGPGQPGAVAAVLPQGPAAAPLKTTSTPEAKGEVDEFQVQLKNLKEMYDQAVQVGLMTKSTGALNGTVNKLMSAQ
jgi:hypothetical protein